MNRPYTDLIKEIEYQGEAFVPIKAIAKLAFGNYYTKYIDVKYSQFDILKHADQSVSYEFHFKPDDGGLWCENIIKIDKNINIDCFGKQFSQNYRVSVADQVQIFKLLTQWGFIE